MAAPLSDDVRRDVVELVGAVRADVDERVAGARSPVRWVRMDGLHLTLRFLGPTPAARVDVVAAALARAAGRARTLRLTISGGGAFPSPSRPRTLWLRVATGAEDLAEVAAAVEDELAREGWPRSERPYRAHLTLARADGRREGPLTARRLIERATELHLDVTVDRLILFDSVTGGGPARYEPLATESLPG